ncbi:MAG: cupin domain-containing protein [Actinobacteria bacterium]|nr:MAG: cupin domain-containing protein [Actinomycetota bacterium]
MADSVRLVRSNELVPGQPTPGMNRLEAFASGSLWAGMVRTEPGMVSGWHHHGDHHSIIHMVVGTMRMESGPGGGDVAEAGPGDFFHIPPMAIHRESNPGSDEASGVVVRFGTGDVVVNVDGPEGSSG